DRRELARPFHRPGWVYEEKYDGWRMLAYKRGCQVQLVSRPGRDHTRRFPALVAAIAGLAPSTLILDGELCIFDERLISRFEWPRGQGTDHRRGSFDRPAQPYAPGGPSPPSDLNKPIHDHDPFPRT